VSTGRVLWVLWCLGWSAFWFFVGVFTILPLFLIPPSLLAILIPVGKEPSPAPQLPPPPVVILPQPPTRQLPPLPPPVRRLPPPPDR